jgi:hypothetical protein
VAWLFNLRGSDVPYNPGACLVHACVVCVDLGGGVRGVLRNWACVWHWRCIDAQLSSAFVCARQMSCV